MTIEKILKGSIALVAVFILSYLIYQKMNPATGVDAKGRLEKLPNFRFPKVGGTGNISKSDLRSGKTVVLYFSPDCEHCQALGADIGRQLAQLQDIDFMFVTRFDEADVINYAQKANLWEQSNVYFGLDVDAAFYGYFGEMFIPSAYVFNQKGKFLQSVHQNAMVKDILDVLEGIPSDKNRSTR